MIPDIKLGFQTILGHPKCHFPAIYRFSGQYRPLWRKSIFDLKNTKSPYVRILSFFTIWSHILQHVAQNLKYVLKFVLQVPKILLNTYEASVWCLDNIFSNIKNYDFWQFSPKWPNTCKIGENDDFSNLNKIKRRHRIMAF